MHVLKYTYSLLLIILILTSVSCNRYSHIDDALDLANSIVEANPDSALRLLATIDTTKLNSPKDKARYALYVTNAKFLGYDPTCNDSLLSTIAVNEYFSNSRDNFDKMLYFYLRGRLYDENKDYTNALNNLLEAAELSKIVDTGLYQGRIHQTIGLIYGALFRGQDALRYNKQALSDFRKTGNIKYVNWQMLNLAQSYYNIGMCDSCEIYLDSIRYNDYYFSDVYLQDNIIRLKAYCLKDENDYEHMVSLLNEIKTPLIDRDYYLKSYAFLKLGELDSAKYYNDKLLSVDTTKVYISYLISEKDGNLQKTTDALKQMYSFENSSLRKIIEDNSLSLENNYLSHKAQISAIKYRNSLWVMLFIIICLLTIIISIVMWHKHINKIRTLEISGYFNTIEKLESIINETKRSLLEAEASKIEILKEIKEKDIDEAENETEPKINASTYTVHEDVDCKINGNISYEYETLNQLCEILNSYNDSLKSIEEKPNPEAHIVKRIHNMIRRYNNSEEYLDTLSKISDTVNNGLITQFREECPQLCKTYYKLFLYKSMSFPVSTIAFMHESSIKAVYNKTHRLKKALLAADTPNKKRFIDILDL